MYKKAYGIIETLAPVHVGASAGEEDGNLNLIFRDQFTQTGVIPGSSVRGRLRADMRMYKRLLEKQQEEGKISEISPDIDEEIWYGQKSDSGSDNLKNEALIKLEYASIVWLPVFCPGQPIVWVSCPSLLNRYKRIVVITDSPPKEYTASEQLTALESKSQNSRLKDKKVLFFNLGFLTIDDIQDLSKWFPLNKKYPAVIVNDNDMAMIHDMALYRQSRVALEDDVKKAKKGAFFNVEALPEGTILAFPIAMKPSDKIWKPINGNTSGEIYLGGLESIGFGHCCLTIKEI
ncbi:MULTISPECIES: RAMP superfamily CRISPR-associated protein [Nostocales]|uniref:Type III-B CRISPR module RAMP protein Cmr4 n=1 Tax=Dolichospermum flos-aquae UHCC 0037 TaxID=2590026 RepID=A0ACC7SAH0_DOLFA|nr:MULTISPECIES: RAMP superfamily CRISPR-associated protein [Nostocales]MBO1065195.1 type III-B CRISPR module RAMP protein Cmr4 [Anabaena sp. 54]MTJ44824.1 type III-B CRISPR module RAMP protein Cmr4 [Dolichospermum flos-aquae UHCC 0037]QSV69844.1 MAG: type III-B CRISPR module RAMP protein Cmr4 [Aphanizomenon flos-aquae KM1D3_PB]